MRSIVRWLVAASVCLCASQASAAWHEARSKHFIIYSDGNPKNLRAFAEKLERFDGAFRYLRQMDDPELTDAGRVTIFLLPDDDALERLMRSQNIRGVYTTRSSGSFAFVPRNSGRGLTFGGGRSSTSVEKTSLDTDAIFFHEYTHHLQLQDWSGVMPMWVREGFAEFYATAEVDARGNVTIGKFPSYRSQEIYFGSKISAEELVAADYETKPHDWSDIYGRSWLLTHFLNVSGQRPGQLNRYLEGIEQGRKPRDAAQAAFGNLKTLSQDVNDYLKPRSFLAFTVNEKAIPVGEVALRPLSAGASDMMEVVIRSKLGTDYSNAPGIAADARRLAASYPSDPFVQAALAEAEYDAEKYGAAAAAADRALAAEPNNVHALIYKGRAEMKLAAANGGRADWAKIRSWFTRANKIDTENAEALMLFYDSYAVSKQALTRNAVDALLYAADLAPADRELRLKAVRQLLAENRLKEARDRFVPAAFETHAKAEWRSGAQAVIDAMDSGNATKASELLDAALKSASDRKSK